MDDGSEITFQSKQESLSSHEVSSFPILLFVSLRAIVTSWPKKRFDCLSGSIFLVLRERLWLS
jgi:hypothetical protein